MNILIDEEKKETMDPILKKKGMSFSSWVRVKMDEFLNDNPPEDYPDLFPAHPGGDAA